MTRLTQESACRMSFNDRPAWRSDRPPNGRDRRASLSSAGRTALASDVKLDYPVSPWAYGSFV